MKRKYLIITIFIFIFSFNNTITSQIVISDNTDLTCDTSAILDIKSSDKGLLIPKISITDHEDSLTINSPTKGLFVYNIADENYGIEGFIYWNGSKWVKIADSSGKITESEFTDFTHVAYVGPFDGQDFINGLKLGEFSFKIASTSTGNTGNLAHNTTSIWIKYNGSGSKNIAYSSLIIYDVSSLVNSNNGSETITNAWKTLGDTNIYTESLSRPNLEKRQYVFTSLNQSDKYFYRCEFMITGHNINSGGDAKTVIYIEKISTKN